MSGASTDTAAKKEYWIVVRQIPGYFAKKTHKYLCRPYEEGGRWSWSRKMVRAARFYDAMQAEAYANDYKVAETMRVSDGI